MERCRLDGEPIVVPAPVLAGIDAVRRVATCNMLDRPTVAGIAGALGHEMASQWIMDNQRAYAEGVFRGFALAEFNWDAELSDFEDCRCSGRQRCEESDGGQ